jgi:hypothetical protein
VPSVELSLSAVLLLLLLLPLLLLLGACVDRQSSHHDPGI